MNKLQFPVDRRQFMVKTAGLAGIISMLSCGKKETEVRESIAPPGWKLKLGIIGLGNRGLSHIRVLESIPEIAISALCDLDESKFSSAQEYAPSGTPTYKDYKEMIAQAGVDAITVCAPNHLHHELSIYGMEHGVHVLCEKPMSINVSNCLAMMEAQKKTGKILLIGTQLRYMELFQNIKRAISEEHVLGDILYGNVLLFRADWPKFSDNPEEDKKLNWRLSNEKMGNSLLEYSIHYIDEVMWMIDKEPLYVMGTGGVNFYKDRTSYDHYSASCVFETGANLNHSLTIYSPDVNMMHVAGEKGIIEIHFLWNEYVLRLKEGNQESLVKIKKRNMGSGTLDEYIEFVKCIQENRKPLTNAESALPVTKVCLAMEDAVREKRLVKLSELA